MVLHGDSDEIVPFSMSGELFDAVKGPKRFYAIEGAGHNDTYHVGGPPTTNSSKRSSEISLDRHSRAVHLVDEVIPSPVVGEG